MSCYRRCLYHCFCPNFIGKIFLYFLYRRFFNEKIQRFAKTISPQYSKYFKIRKQHDSKEMAHFFYISTRSYCDLEGGKYSLSAVSLIILLAYLPNDVMVQVVREFFNLILDEQDKEDD